jgi:hypothetical protein
MESHLNYSSRKAVSAGVILLALTIAFGGPGLADERLPDNCERIRARDRGKLGPKPGSLAPDFELTSVDGKTVRGSSLWSAKPTVLMLGSYTCPMFRDNVDDFEALARDFGNQVNFIVLYTVEAHPKGDPSPYTGREWVRKENEKIGLLLPQPKTIQERTERAQACVHAMKLTMPVIIDNMENGTWKAYGSAPNSAYLIGQDGKVIEQEGWFEAAKMRETIKQALK